MKKNLNAIRTDYGKHFLTKENAGDNALDLLEKWLAEALANEEVLDPNAFVLSTLDLDGFPTGRIVLLRSVEAESLVFFTNYLSHKGRELERHNKASATFFWPAMERQIRVAGTVERISEEASDAYFQSRPRGSQIGAWASKQSESVNGRFELEKAVADFEAEYEGKEIPRPPHWGGYAIKVEKIEFWQGRNSRLHDRILFQKEPSGAWKKSRLNP